MKQRDGLACALEVKKFALVNLIRKTENKPTVHIVAVRSLQSFQFEFAMPEAVTNAFF